MKLNEFLVKAKVRTYAITGENIERNLEDGSKELVYKEKGFSYRDSYFGFNPFIGQEIVWQNGNLIWSMNYYGFITENKMNPKEVYAFLKKVLRNVEQNKPFRGPSKLKDKNFEYTNKVKGNIKNFTGIERIYYKKKQVYALYYHGGVVTKTL